MRSSEIPPPFPSDQPSNKSQGKPSGGRADHAPQVEALLTPVADDGSLPGPGQRQLVLNKQGLRYVFRYTVGQEASFLKGIQALASSKNSTITWFDAAVLCHQMGQRLSQDLNALKSA